jgi:hypothetical protein
VSDQCQTSDFDQFHCSATGGLQLANEAAVEVLFEEVPKGFGFYFGGAINWTKRWVLTFLDVNVVVKLWVEVGELIGFQFAEDIQEVVIVSRDLRVKVVEFVGREVIGFCSVKSGIGAIESVSSNGLTCCYGHAT